SHSSSCGLVSVCLLDKCGFITKAVKPAFLSPCYLFNCFPPLTSSINLPQEGYSRLTSRLLIDRRAARCSCQVDGCPYKLGAQDSLLYLRHSLLSFLVVLYNGFQVCYVTLGNGPER